MSGAQSGLVERIRKAKETVSLAQRELDETLAQLEAPDRARAEKTMITEVLRDALQNLSSARDALERAESVEPPKAG